MPDKPVVPKLVLYNEHGEVEVTSETFIAAALDVETGSIHTCTSVIGVTAATVVELAATSISAASGLMMETIDLDVREVREVEGEEAIDAVIARRMRDIKGGGAPIGNEPTVPKEED